VTPPRRAPRHLKDAARALWTDVTATFVLEPHHLAVLVKGLEAFDRAEAAREAIERDGILTTSRLGEVKAHPAVAIERDARAQFFVAIKALGLDIDGPPSPSTRNRRG